MLDGLKKEESREKREETREKRENRRKLDSLHFYTVPEGRDGREKGRPLGEKRADSTEKERREKREEIKSLQSRFTAFYRVPKGT